MTTRIVDHHGVMHRAELNEHDGMTTVCAAKYHRIAPLGCDATDSPQARADFAEPDPPHSSRCKECWK